MQWIRTNCRILLPSSGPGRLTAPILLNRPPSPLFSPLSSCLSRFPPISLPYAPREKARQRELQCVYINQLNLVLSMYARRVHEYYIDQQFKPLNALVSPGTFAILRTIILRYIQNVINSRLFQILIKKNSRLAIRECSNNY